MESQNRNKTLVNNSVAGEVMLQQL